MKKLLSIFLAVILLFSCVQPVRAAVVEPDAPCFSYISSVSASLTINESTGVARCYARCSTSKSNVTITIIGTLQQYRSEKWNYVASWSKSGSPTVILDEQCTVSRGYQYRFVVYFYIYDTNGNLLESTSLIRVYDYT